MKRFAPVILLLAAALASATTIIPMSVEQLTKVSEHIVEGRAVAQWSAWDPEHKLILTYTQFQVTRSLKGSTSQVIIVKQLGGRVGDDRMKVAGVRYFQPNEQAVLFLHPAMANDGTYVITGLMQGNFHVEGTGAGAIVSNGVPAVRSYIATTQTITSYTGAHMTLNELEIRVQKAVRR